MVSCIHIRRKNIANVKNIQHNNQILCLFSITQMTGFHAWGIEENNIQKPFSLHFFSVFISIEVHTKSQTKTIDHGIDVNLKKHLSNTIFMIYKLKLSVYRVFSIILLGKPLTQYFQRC